MADHGGATLDLHRAGVGGVSHRRTAPRPTTRLGPTGRAQSQDPPLLETLRRRPDCSQAYGRAPGRSKARGRAPSRPGRPTKTTSGPSTPPPDGRQGGTDTSSTPPHTRPGPPRAGLPFHRLRHTVPLSSTPGVQAGKQGHPGSETLGARRLLTLHVTGGGPPRRWVGRWRLKNRESVTSSRFRDRHPGSTPTVTGRRPSPGQWYPLHTSTIPILG